MINMNRPLCALHVRLVAIAALAALAPSLLASPPLEPIPVPMFSFDALSPSASSTGLMIPADAVLTKGPEPDGHPVVLFSGPNLGLGREGDELDDITFTRSGFTASQAFILMFSVDRATTGGGFPPNPQQIAAETPFTVSDQALRGHAAGDAFVTFNRFNRNGIIAPLRAAPPNSQTQAANNYDEGGRDFQATPPTSSRDYVATAQDNVDSLALEPAGPALRTAPPLYYTVSSQSTSLRTGMLPGTSGADIFIKVNPQSAQPPVQQFASGLQLGLPAVIMGDDDIDGLVVFDENENGTYDAGDLVLFSLKAGSPSLNQIGGRINSAADIFAARAIAGGISELSLFAPALDLGLAGSNDDVDGLEVYPCNATDGSCTINAGIRFIKGDVDNDGDVDIVDYPQVVTCLSGPKEGVGFTLPSLQCREALDFNRDSDVDLHDFARFQRAFGTGTP